MPSENLKSNKKAKIVERLIKIVTLIFWLVLIIIIFINKNKITVESIVNATPENKLSAAVIMLALFALKSITVFVYGGILYAASGLIFPLPEAIVINILGTAVMTGIPYFIGRKAGNGAVEKFCNRYPKLEILRQNQNKNEFLVSFFVRIIGIFPSDLVGMYLGATGIHYGRYFCGTMLGFLPSVLLFSIMGMSIKDPASPAFVISAVCEVLLMIFSVTVSFVIQHRHKKRKADKK